MNKYTSTALLALYIALLTSCNSKQAQEGTKTTIAVKADTISYSADSTAQIGYFAYDEANHTQRPIVLVVPEWWGLNDYTQSRVKQLAELGYIAIAVDMYGEGKTADNPQSAGELATPFYTNPILAQSRFNAALEKAKTLSMADSTKIAAIGYCFGGAMVLNMAKLGENLKGVVSFHGGLLGVPINKNTIKAKILVCHGEADQFVPQAEVTTFKRQMDSIGADYLFKSYPEATHAFSNPAATETGKKFSIPIAYNRNADSLSWNEMKSFFNTIFN